MSKAEDRYLEYFQDGRVRNCSNKDAFLYGYQQAEKDLELTWKDIEKITDIWDDLHEDETMYSKTGCDTPEFYQEVLKRFKDYKERKEK